MIGAKLRIGATSVEARHGRLTANNIVIELAWGAGRFNQAGLAQVPQALREATTCRPLRLK